MASPVQAHLASGSTLASMTLWQDGQMSPPRMKRCGATKKISHLMLKADRLVRRHLCKISVPVGVWLEWPGNIETNVIGLLFRKCCEFRAQCGKVQARHFLIKLFGE